MLQLPYTLIPFFKHLTPVILKFIYFTLNILRLHVSIYIFS